VSRSCQGGTLCSDANRSTDPLVYQAIDAQNEGYVDKIPDQTFTCAYDRYRSNALGNCIFDQRVETTCRQTFASGDPCPRSGGGGSPN